MRRIAGSQTRIQREQRKYLDKSVPSTFVPRSGSAQPRPDRLSLNSKRVPKPTPLDLDKDWSPLDKVGVPQRPQLSPDDSDLGSDLLSSTPTTPRSPTNQVAVPTLAVNGIRLRPQAYSTPVKKSISTGADDVFTKNAIEDALEYSSANLNFQSVPAQQKREQFDWSPEGRLQPPPTSVRRHASLAVDDPSRRLQGVRTGGPKRGSVAMEQIKKVDLDDVYDVYKQLGSGRFGLIKLAEHKQSRQKIAIKFFPRPQIKQGDFVREYNFSFFLSPHPNIIDTYDGMYQTSNDSAFFFVQEFCPHASLREAVETSSSGLGEVATKEILSKVLSAIEFMHNENLVHRNLKAENILIFDEKNYSRVKLTDFGLTRKVDSTVKYQEYVTHYHAPELCETVVNEVLTVRCSSDIWALGIIFYYCLKGKFPWQKATIMCKPYWEWEQWLKRKNPNLPKRWDPFSEKSLKVFKKCLNPKPKDRWTVKDMRKYIAKEKLLKTSKVTQHPSLHGHSHHHHHLHPLGDTVSQESLHRTQSLRRKSDSPDEYVYYPDQATPTKEDKLEEPKVPKKRSIIQQWINTTLNTMAEISEQVVSARDE